MRGRQAQGRAQHSPSSAEWPGEPQFPCLKSGVIVGISKGVPLIRRDKICKASRTTCFLLKNNSLPGRKRQRKEEKEKKEKKSKQVINRTDWKLRLASVSSPRTFGTYICLSKVQIFFPEPPFLPWEAVLSPGADARTRISDPHGAERDLSCCF